MDPCDKHRDDGGNGMKLDEYVKQALLDITKGVMEASNEAVVTIAPSGIEGNPIFEPQLVTFDLAITESIEAGGGINVLSMADGKVEKNPTYKQAFI